MEHAFAVPGSEAPAAADVEFEALYRSSRDDVFAYAAGLLRDRAAAEDVTALAFERAYRKRRRFDPSDAFALPAQADRFARSETDPFQSRHRGLTFLLARDSQPRGDSHGSG